MLGDRERKRLGKVLTKVVNELKSKGIGRNKPSYLYVYLGRGVRREKSIWGSGC